MWWCRVSLGIFYHGSGNGIWDGVGRGFWGMVLSWFPDRRAWLFLADPTPLLPGLERPLDIVLISFVFGPSRPIWPKQLHPIDKLFKAAYTRIFQKCTQVVWFGKVWGGWVVHGRIRNTIQQFVVTSLSISNLHCRPLDHFSYETVHSFWWLARSKQTSIFLVAFLLHPHPVVTHGEILISGRNN